MTTLGELMGPSVYNEKLYKGRRPIGLDLSQTAKSQCLSRGPCA
jgi:hypothetical protein